MVFKLNKWTYTLMRLTVIGGVLFVLFLALGIAFITHETCPAESELSSTRSRPFVPASTTAGKELLSNEARKSIIVQKPLFGMLFWGQFPFSYEELRLLAGKEYADLLLLQLTNEFLSEGSGMRSILDYGGTLIGKSDSVGMLQINPLYLLDAKILELVNEYLARLPARYHYLSYSKSNDNWVSLQKSEGNFPLAMKKAQALVEIIDLLSITAARVQFLKQIGNYNYEKEAILNRELLSLKSEGTALLKGYLGRTLDKKCKNINHYQPLNVLFALALNVRHKSMAKSFLNSIGITKENGKEMFDGLSNFMTIISYKNGPNYTREMMVHNIGLLVGAKLFNIDLSWQKNIHKHLARGQAGDRGRRKKREEKLLLVWKEIFSKMKGWIDNPPKPDDKLYQGYLRFVQLTRKDKLFLHDAEVNLFHLIKAHKETNQTIKFFRYFWNERGKLVLKYPKLRELVRFVTRTALLENPVFFKEMLLKGSLLNSDFNQPILEGNYYLQVLNNIEKYTR